MQPGIAHFADGIQTIHVRTAMIVNHDATTGIVSGWHNRYRVTRQINPKAEQLFINHREMLTDKLSRFVADIQIHAIHAKTFHLVIDSAGDDITRRKLASRVKVRHKT